MDIDLKDQHEADWARWIQALKKPTKLYHCPHELLESVSVLPSHVQIESIYIPYFCESCGAEEFLLIEREGFSAIQDKIVCPVCSNVMNLEIVKDQFLQKVG